MLRIHFTGDDLARLRVATAPDPLWEVLLSLHALRGRPRSPMLRHWRDRQRAAGSPPALLLGLAPPRGYSPDFLTPTAGTSDVRAGVHAVLRTPRARLVRDLNTLAAQRTPPPEARLLADGHAGTLRRLGDALHGYYRQALEPHWAAMTARIDLDRAVRGRAFLDGGVDRVLTTLHPTVRWRAPVLEVDYPRDQAMRLAGRGLLLMPSVFCRRPITLLDQELPPVLVYPVEQDPTLFAAPAADERPGGRSGPPVAALLGRTRAAALAAVGEAGCTTTELSRRLGISLASASRHATVLREAGLVTSHRDRNAVHHVATHLGRALLDA